MSANKHKKIDMLRHRKVNKKPTEFTPSDAYIIIGHGNEPKNAFIVPDNCIIVVKYHPGELAWSNSMYPLLNVVGAPENVEIYKDPIHHKKDIIDQVGSVIIYEPGDRCPNYIYRLVWNEDNFLLDETGNHFGLISIPLKTPLQIITNEGDTTLKETMTNIYADSVLPTADKVLISISDILGLDKKNTIDDVFGRVLELGPCNPKISNSYKNPFCKFKDKFTYTQKDLLDIDESGNARRPGVYYNFICRAAGNINISQNYLNTLTRVSNANRFERGLIKRRIVEAETKRKHLIPGTKYTRGGSNYKTRKVHKNKIFH